MINNKKLLDGLTRILEEPPKTRCPICGGPLTAFRPDDVSGVPKVELFCIPCEARE